MSPEYAMDGIFSVKSDVFSYGVLLLEIVSGRRNRGVYSYSTNQSLLGHVSESLPHLMNVSSIYQESFNKFCQPTFFCSAGMELMERGEEHRVSR